MDEKQRKFAENIKNRMASELSDETLHMIWGWKNKVQPQKCEDEDYVDLLREMIDEITRDAVARDMVNRVREKAMNDDEESQ